MHFCILRRIQDGCQKWQESDFCEMSPLHSAYTLRVQNFHRNRSISYCFQEKCVFAYLLNRARYSQKWRKSDFWEKSSVDSIYTVQVKKFRQNRSISHRFQDKCAFAFYTKIQDGHQKWQGSDF